MKTASFDLFWILLGLCAAAEADEEDLSKLDLATLMTLEVQVTTAQKRSENVQTVPIAITAFTAQALQDKGVGDIHALSKLTPNVNLDAGSPFSGSSSVLSASIRGIGQDDFAMNLDPGVGVYVDGVYLARTVGANQNLLGVDRVEILKGPQGTLFGRNTIGGAINIATHTPGDAFAGAAELATGSYKRRDIAATFDIPISANLLSTFTVSSAVRDGYQRRIPTPGLPAFTNIPHTQYPQSGYFSNGDTQGGLNQQVIRGKLLFRPSDALRVTLAADWTHEDQSALPNTVRATTEGPGGGFLVNLYNLCTSFDSLAAVDTVAFGGALPAVCGPIGPGLVAGAGGLVTPGPTLYGHNIPQYNAGIAVTGDIDTSYATGNNFSQLESWGAALTADWTLSPALSLKSITGFRGLHWRSGVDNDGSVLVLLEPSFEEGQHQLSQEFQLIGDAFDARLTYVLGGYYFNETGYVHDKVAVAVVMVDGRNSIDTTSYAGFAHANFRVSNRVGLTAGARYSIDKKELIGGQSDPGAFPYKIAGCYPITPACVTAVGSPDPSDPLRLFPPGVNKQTFNELTPALGAEYHFSDNVMAYVSYSKGFKSGGWTTRVPNPILNARDAAFGPERAHTYEAGIKSELFDQHLRLNWAVFNTRYENIQLTELNGPAPTIKNAGTARIRGAELEGSWLAGHGLSIQGAAGYMDAYYIDTLPGTGFSSAEALPLNTPLPKTPKWKVSVGPQFEHKLANGGALRFIGNWTHTSAMSNDIANTPLLARASTDILDLSVAYGTQAGKYEIVLGGTNVTDERYVNTGQNQVAGGQVQATFSRPAEWYLQLKAKL